MAVRRIYVEKKQPYAGDARALMGDLKSFLGVTGITNVRKLIRYDVENVSDDVFELACRTVFSEPPVDILYRETIDIPEGARVFSVEALWRAKSVMRNSPASKLTASTRLIPERPEWRSPRH